ncbi:RNA-directed DNA polymerase, eukaryota, reverse transcriptase zinc-binding domain protein [Tanacetum coccineum]
MGLTHVCFTNDLLVFGHGDGDSVEVFKKRLEEFGSGLLPNVNKSFVFFGNISDEDKRNILEILPFCETKGKSVWEVEHDQINSWGWKNILELRNEIKEHMRKVGNVCQISVWFDKWSDFGVLFSHLSYRALYNARLAHDCTLRDMIGVNGWNWHVERYELFPQICHEVKFTVKQAYLDLTSDYLIAKWYKLSWFTQCTPKHNFIMWMAIQEKLLTQDNIIMILWLEDSGISNSENDVDRQKKRFLVIMLHMVVVWSNVVYLFFCNINLCGVDGW